MRYLTFWLLQLIQLTTFASAGPSNWTKPNGQSPSFTDTYTVGEHIFVSWLSLNDSVNDLWLTRYDPRVDTFAVRLQVARNISYPDNFEWTIAVNATEVTEDTRFILQFLPTGSAYNASQSPQIPSPPFNLINLNQQALPNGTIGAPSVTPSASSVISSQTIALPSSVSSVSPSDIPSQGDRGPAFTRSIAIGVSIAAVVLVLGTIVGAFFVVRTYKQPKRKDSDDMTEELKTSGPYEVLGTNRQPTELSSKETMVHELNSPTETTMTHESDMSPVYEMSTTIKRPGLHEMPG